MIPKMFLELLPLLNIKHIPNGQAFGFVAGCVLQTQYLIQQ